MNVHKFAAAVAYASITTGPEAHIRVIIINYSTFYKILFYSLCRQNNPRWITRRFFGNSDNHLQHCIRLTEHFQGDLCHLGAIAERWYTGVIAGVPQRVWRVGANSCFWNSFAWQRIGGQVVDYKSHWKYYKWRHFTKKTYSIRV